MERRLKLNLETWGNTMKLYLIIDTFEDEIIKSFLEKRYISEFIEEQRKGHLYGEDNRYRIVSLDVGELDAYPA